jgi:hypothetical protein
MALTPRRGEVNHAGGLWPTAFAPLRCAGYPQHRAFSFGGIVVAGLDLTIDELLLDLENPRISKAESQREALQKVIEDQDVKLVVLAESIVADGLNPMDRCDLLPLNAPVFG